jgi:hypothetical protein
MQHHELAKHLACIEDHLMRWNWDSWDFELTNTTNLYSPWSNPPIPQVQPNDRLIAKYILKNKARQPVAFCLAELESESLDEIKPEEEFHKTLASFHAVLEDLPVAMYTHRGWVWDYVNIAKGEDWHEDDPHLSVPLDPHFVDELAGRDL